MVKKKWNQTVPTVEEGSVHAGNTEAWNIAQYYTGYSIALPLKDLNELEDIARFGSVRLDDEMSMADDHVDKRRAEAVRRYWQKLNQIIGDTMFKVKKGDKLKAKAIYGWMQTIPKFFDALLDVKRDSVDEDNQIVVNEKFLTLLINELSKKKQEYLYVLDHAGLIFREVDEVDLDKMTNDFVHGG